MLRRFSIGAAFWAVSFAAAWAGVGSVAPARANAAGPVLLLLVLLLLVGAALVLFGLLTHLRIGLLQRRLDVVAQGMKELRSFVEQANRTATTAARQAGDIPAHVKSAETAILGRLEELAAAGSLFVTAPAGPEETAPAAPASEPAAADREPAAAVAAAPNPEPSAAQPSEPLAAAPPAPDPVPAAVPPAPPADEGRQMGESAAPRRPAPDPMPASTGSPRPARQRLVSEETLRRAGHYEPAPLADKPAAAELAPRLPVPPPVEGKPAAPVSAQLERLLSKAAEAGSCPEGLRLLQQRVDDASAPNQALANAVLDWLTWLTEKASALRELPPDKLADKVRLWHRSLDQFLFADPAAAMPPADTEDDPLLTEAFLKALPGALRSGQRTLLQHLAGQGIERIEAAPGDEFVPGVVEQSGAPPVPTHESRLNGRVAGIEPGEGGYRFNGRTLMPTLARRYVYVPGP